MSNGTIKKLVSERGFGFIAGDDGIEYFFHRDGLDGLVNFDTLREVMIVTGQQAPPPQPKPPIEQPKPIPKPTAQPARADKTKANPKSAG